MKDIEICKILFKFFKIKNIYSLYIYSLIYMFMNIRTQI